MKKNKYKITTNLNKINKEKFLQILGEELFKLTKTNLTNYESPNK